MLDYYEARRNGTATMTEDEVRAEVDRLSAEYILTKPPKELRERMRLGLSTCCAPNVAKLAMERPSQPR
jgi:hypothetical protein